jgi:uncharacterized protein YraI
MNARTAVLPETALLCAIIFTAVPAHAEHARAISNANMRIAPGISYPVVDIVPRGALVNARYCISNGWCRVTWRGNRGWINGRYLRIRSLKRKA